MKKALVAAVLIGLTGSINASEMERLKGAGFPSLSMDAVKGVNITITNTSINNGSSSINSNVGVNNANANIAVTNNSSNNGVSDINTVINAHNGAINAGVTNNNNGNLISNTNTAINAHTGNITAGVNNNNNGNLVAITNTAIDAGNGPVNAAVNNTNNGNLISQTGTSINAHHGNINAGVNNVNNGNGAAGTHTDLNLNNTNPGATIGASVVNSNINNGIADTDNDITINTPDEDGATVNIGNTDNGNGIADTDNDVTVNGVSAAAKKQTYKSPALYRFQSQARQAMNKAVNNLKAMKDVKVLSGEVREISCSGYSFEVKFAAVKTLETFASKKVFYNAPQAEEALGGKVYEFKGMKRQIVSAEILESGFKYSFAIAYFPAK